MCCCSKVKFPWYIFIKMTKIHFIFTFPMATGSFPPCSPPSPKEMLFNQTVPCWRGYAAVDCAPQAESKMELSLHRVSGAFTTVWRCTVKQQTSLQTCKYGQGKRLAKCCPNHKSGNTLGGAESFLTLRGSLVFQSKPAYITHCSLLSWICTGWSDRSAELSVYSGLSNSFFSSRDT